MSIIWLPNRGYTSNMSREVDKAVNQYDEQLYFAFNEMDKVWCIYRKISPTQPDMVICGFTAIPTPEDALEFLWKKDTKRHGANKLWEDHIKELGKERNRKSPELEDAAEETAEAIESYSRGQQKLRYWKSYNKEFESKKTGGKN